MTLSYSNFTRVFSFFFVLTVAKCCTFLHLQQSKAGAVPPVVDGAAGDLGNQSWWPKSSRPDDASQYNLSVANLAGALPGSAPSSLPQSPLARRGVNLLDEVVSAFYCQMLTTVVQYLCNI